jgi:hypothetical protein
MGVTEDTQNNLDQDTDLRDRAAAVSASFGAFAAMWKAVTGQDTDRNNVIFQRLANGDPSSTLVKEAWVTYDNLRNAEKWANTFTELEVGRDTFNDVYKSIGYWQKWESRFGSTGNFTEWIGAADDFQQRNPNTTLDRQTLAMELLDKWRVPSRYFNHQNAKALVAGYSDEVQEAFGDDLYSFAANQHGFQQIGQEVTDYEDLRQLYHDTGMDVAQATRDAVGSILGEHGSIANYRRWLRGGQISAAFSDQFAKFADLGFGGVPSTKEMQESFRSQGETAFNMDIQRKLGEFSVRRTYLNQGAAGRGESAALGANPNLGRVGE